LTANGDTDINLALSISIDEMRRYQGGQKVNQLFLFSDGNPTRGETDWIQIRNYDKILQHGAIFVYQPLPLAPMRAKSNLIDSLVLLGESIFLS
jgi:hypothetical protein